MSPTRLLVIGLVFPAAPLFAQDTRLPAGTPGTVTLSRTDYDHLLDLAGTRPARPDLPPVAAALSRADIRVRANASSARATMRVDGQAFREGVSKVTLIRNATLLDARMDGRPLPVIADGAAHVALVTGPSTFSATLDVGMPLAFSPGRASFTLPVPDAGSAVASIDVPGDQADVRVPGGLIARRASANGRTVVDVTLAPGRPTEVSWSTHETAPTPAAARDVRLLSDVKTIVTIGEAEVRLASIVTTTTIAGQPAQIAVAIPAGYEVASVSGPTLERSETQPGRVMLFPSEPSLRRQQFLIALDRPYPGGSFSLDTAFPSIPSAQRESGEVAVEGVGTLDVTAPDSPGLQRVDVRELDRSLTSVAHDSLISGWRYRSAADEPPALHLDIRRFADAPVLTAVAERAMATTLVTSEGRALTEVTLWVRNRAQRYMRVNLPPGATIVSAEVAGTPSKPVEGSDGNRVPLVGPGTNTLGTYTVSFVYLHAGTPFDKKGDMRMTLPKMDVPIDVVEWELFVPEQFKVDRFDGNLIDARLMPSALHASGSAAGFGVGPGAAGGTAGSVAQAPLFGQISGVVRDTSGAPLPGAQVTLVNGSYRQVVTTDAIGSYVVSNVPSGTVTIISQLAGFKTAQRRVQFNQDGQRVDLALPIGAITEQVTVDATSPVVDTRTAAKEATIRTAEEEAAAQKKKDETEAPSLNVQNLQRRVAGVLPVRIDVPRAGTSHTFVKPLVIDEEAHVTFRYKRK